MPMMRFVGSYSKYPHFKTCLRLVRYMLDTCWRPIRDLKICEKLVRDLWETFQKLSNEFFVFVYSGGSTF